MIVRNVSTILSLSGGPFTIGHGIFTGTTLPIPATSSEQVTTVALSLTIPFGTLTTAPLVAFGFSLDGTKYYYDYFPTTGTDPQDFTYTPPVGAANIALKITNNDTATNIGAYAQLVTISRD
jgi:hypothetical protein